MFRFGSGNSDKEAQKSINEMLVFICEYTDDNVGNIRLLAIEVIRLLIPLIKEDQKLNTLIVKQIRKVFKSEPDAEVKHIIKSVHKILKK